jgi:hypothetical protein
VQARAGLQTANLPVNRDVLSMAFSLRGQRFASQLVGKIQAGAPVDESDVAPAVVGAEEQKSEENQPVVA